MCKRYIFITVYFYAFLIMNIIWYHRLLFIFITLTFVSYWFSLSIKVLLLSAYRSLDLGLIGNALRVEWKFMSSACPSLRDMQTVFIWVRYIGKYSTRSTNKVWAFRQTPYLLNMCCIVTYRTKKEQRLYFLTRSSHTWHHTMCSILRRLLYVPKVPYS